MHQGRAGSGKISAVCGGYGNCRSVHVGDRILCIVNILFCNYHVKEVAVCMLPAGGQGSAGMPQRPIPSPLQTLH